MTPPTARPARRPTKGTAMRPLVPLAFVVLLAHAAGCAPDDKPFMGVPEDKEVLIRDEVPESAIGDVPKITAVQAGDYQEYLRLKQQGKLVAEERRGQYVYYAIENDLCVPLGEASAMVTVTERYKARVPQGR